MACEELAFAPQPAILDRKLPRPELKDRDRLFWVLLSQLWSNWQSVLVIVKPETVIRWHRQGFKYYWRWKSRHKPGRPLIDIGKLVVRHDLLRSEAREH